MKITEIDTIMAKRIDFMTRNDCIRNITPENTRIYVETYMQKHGHQDNADVTAQIFHVCESFSRSVRKVLYSMVKNDFNYIGGLSNWEILPLLHAELVNDQAAANKVIKGNTLRLAQVVDKSEKPDEDRILVHQLDELLTPLYQTVANDELDYDAENLAMARLIGCLAPLNEDQLARIQPAVDNPDKYFTDLKYCVDTFNNIDEDEDIFARDTFYHDYRRAHNNII